MSREVHVRFCESGRVQLPPATHLVVLVSGTQAHAAAAREEVGSGPRSDGFAPFGSKDEGLPHR
jgi:hypothetical protein